MQISFMDTSREVVHLPDDEERSHESSVCETGSEWMNAVTSAEKYSLLHSFRIH